MASVAGGMREARPSVARWGASQRKGRGWGFPPAGRHPRAGCSPPEGNFTEEPYSRSPSAPAIIVRYGVSTRPGPPNRTIASAACFVSR